MLILLSTFIEHVLLSGDMQMNHTALLSGCLHFCEREQRTYWKGPLQSNMRRWGLMLEVGSVGKGSVEGSAWFVDCQVSRCSPGS